jgi:AbrB family looped-hinge helix DNA binding protein
MATATVTGKGRITIPVRVRQALKVMPGDRVEFVELAPGEYLLLATNRSVSELKGMFGKPKNPVSIDEMNRAIAARGASAK